jgi:Cysteine-rich secretory protein family
MLAISAINAYEQEFYCENQQKLCKGLRLPHIACANEDWDDNRCGEERSMVDMTHEIIDAIVDYHNTCRSKIATGTIYGGEFGTAKRMATIQWDSELAKLAEINSKTCRMAHSSCVNTPEYKMVGENLYIKERMPKFEDDLTLMKIGMKAWFTEYKQVSQDEIKQAPGGGR